jgi:hypothetical protein
MRLSTSKNSARTVNGVLAATGAIALVGLSVISLKMYKTFAIVSEDQKCQSYVDSGIVQAVDMVKEMLSQATTMGLALFAGLAFVALKTPQYARAPESVKRTRRLALSRPRHSTGAAPPMTPRKPICGYD